jgi:hypothetical protein
VDLAHLALLSIERTAGGEIDMPNKIFSKKQAARDCSNYVMGAKYKMLAPAGQR